MILQVLITMIAGWINRHQQQVIAYLLEENRAKGFRDLENTKMTTRIINRGRGPEVEGTRITVYRIMDFVRDNRSVPYIANELDLSEEQVLAALAYIAANRSDVEAEYDQLLQRVQQVNPPHVQAGRAKSFDVLKERIRARRLKDLNHADLDG